MSIIHEALKKAEREREPFPHGIPVHRLAPSRRHRWSGIGLARLFVGVIIGGVLGASMWLELGGVLPWSSARRPKAPEIRQDSAAGTRGHQPAAHTAVLGERQVALPPSEPQGVPPAARSLSPSEVAATHAGAEALFERAVSAEAGGQWDEAVQHYRQALAQDPGLLKARNNLGNLYIRQHQLPEAIAQFQAALVLAPEYAYARNNLGSAYLMMGQEAEAIQEFLTALRLDGSYVSPYYNLAAIYARRRDLAHVIAFLTKAIALEPAVLSWIGEDADFDGMRTAPAFQHLGMPKHARR